MVHKKRSAPNAFCAKVIDLKQRVALLKKIKYYLFFPFLSMDDFSEDEGKNVAFFNACTQKMTEINTFCNLKGKRLDRSIRLLPYALFDLNDQMLLDCYAFLALLALSLPTLLMVLRKQNMQYPLKIGYVPPWVPPWLLIFGALSLFFALPLLAPMANHFQSTRISRLFFGYHIVKNLFFSLVYPKILMIYPNFDDRALRYGLAFFGAIDFLLFALLLLARHRKIRVALGAFIEAMNGCLDAIERKKERLKALKDALESPDANFPPGLIRKTLFPFVEEADMIDSLLALKIMGKSAGHFSPKKLNIRCCACLDAKGNHSLETFSFVAFILLRALYTTLLILYFSLKKAPH